MKKMSLYDRAAAVLIGLLDISEEEATPEASLMDDFTLDPLGIILLIRELEKELGFNMPCKKIGEIKTFSDLIETIVSTEQRATASAAYELMLPHFVASAPG